MFVISLVMCCVYVPLHYLNCSGLSLCSSVKLKAKLKPCALLSESLTRSNLILLSLFQYSICVTGNLILELKSDVFVRDAKLSLVVFCKIFTAVYVGMYYILTHLVLVMQRQMIGNEFCLKGTGNSVFIYPPHTVLGHY